MPKTKPRSPILQRPIIRSARPAPAERPPSPPPTPTRPPTPAPPTRPQPPRSPTAPNPARPAPTRREPVEGPSNLATRIDDACNFILERKQSHAASIAWEVGQYLFERTFAGDLDYLASKDRNKPDSLADIAQKTGIHRVRLASWVRAYVAQKYLAPHGVTTDLSMTELEALRPLILHPDAATAVLQLRDRHNLTTQQLDALAIAWKRHLDEGGRLQDLLNSPLPPSISPRPKHPHRKRPPKRPDLAIPRLALVVQRWLQLHHFAPNLQASLSNDLRRIRASAALASTVPIAAPPGARLLPSPPSPLPSPLSPVPSPLSPQLVSSAVAFIEQNLRRHTLEFALEVGRYLFEHVYDGDRTLFRNGGHPWQSATILQIARDPRVALDAQFLYRAIHVFLLRDQVAQELPAAQLPQLPASSWNALWPLQDQPAALVPVARWAESECIPVRTVAAVVDCVAPYLAAGGKLDDLLVTPRRTPPDTPYQRLKRILSVLESLVAKTPLDPRARAITLSTLDSCLLF